jgi:hypothetical protein
VIFGPKDKVGRADWASRYYSISSRGIWLPGIYETAAVARWACQFDYDALRKLANRVCAGEQRPITRADLGSLR